MSIPVITVSGVLAIVAIVELVIIVAVAMRNSKLVDDIREVTKGAIEGFHNINQALHAIRDQLQEGDNSLMGKINDAEKRIYDKVVEAEKESNAHLQYLRDRTK